jgi:hypothetical protein
VRGLFIKEEFLPVQDWQKFNLIAQARGLTPVTLIEQLIKQEIREFDAMQKPLLEQVIQKGAQLIHRHIGNLDKNLKNYP